MPEQVLLGGTGMKLTQATIVLAGVSSLIASLLSILSIWHQAKNYRKPLLQRYVIRILLMVPIYSLSSWSSIVSLRAAMLLDPIRDIYEAFTIYTFFQLLINFIGGERALIIMMYGREPVEHLFPLKYCLPKVDISDPHTFLAIKRGILQYTWLKPVFGFISLIMKATGIYKEGYLGLDSGYLWSGIAYNLSVTISLYSLGLFWVCMSKDLQPFRPLPKFLCIKLIIFASYWQGFFLSILVWSGAIPDNVEGYTSDNIAMAIQDSLICIEMPIFAIGHWYAFSWHDYADAKISAARMPIKYALRDAFGIRDLIEDTKETFSGNKYKYRFFDSGDNVLAHEGSSSRVARMLEGMRYERSGGRKYWIPKPGEANARTPLLFNDNTYRSQTRFQSSRAISTSTQNSPQEGRDIEELLTDLEEENLYNKARALEYGDWNYPVITVQEASLGPQLDKTPDIVTTSTDQYFSHRAGHSDTQRGKNYDNLESMDPKNRIECSQSMQIKNKSYRPNRSVDSSYETVTDVIAAAGKSNNLLSQSSKNSDKLQKADIIVKDSAAEKIEKARAKKEGSASRNMTEPKRYVRTYGENTYEDIYEDFEPSDDNNSKNKSPINQEILSTSANIQNDKFYGSEESRKWGEEIPPSFKLKPKYGIIGEAFENVWSGFEPSKPPKENP